MARKTVEELEKLRLQGIKIASIEEITDKQAERRAKKEKEQARKAKFMELYHAFFPETKQLTEKEFKQQLIFFDFNKALWETRNEVRSFREAAVQQGITHQVLPDNLRERVSLAFTKFNHDRYRDVLWSLVTEGLKVQDRVIKRLAFDTADRWLSEGKADFGWLMNMLAYPHEDKNASMYYVSRYGWALLRKHANKLAHIGIMVLKDSFDYWAERPETWEKWNRLASEDGLPADIRELYAQIAGNNPL